MDFQISQVAVMSQVAYRLFQIVPEGSVTGHSEWIREHLVGRALNYSDYCIARVFAAPVAIGPTHRQLEHPHF